MGAEPMPATTMPDSVTRNARIAEIRCVASSIAATASDNCPVIPAVATSNAAPGVLQANLTGTRNTMLTTIDSRPWMRQITSSPDAACDWVAPAATRPASTIANVFEKPVMAATIPATVGWTRGIGGFSRPTGSPSAYGLGGDRYACPSPILRPERRSSWSSCECWATRLHRWSRSFTVHTPVRNAGIGRLRRCPGHRTRRDVLLASCISHQLSPQLTHTAPRRRLERAESPRRGGAPMCFVKR